tara:strand:- start:2396 stop:2497 length:102 start_codon:yes stop_codon:yes gene_type:complete
MTEFWFVMVVGIVAYVAGVVTSPWINKLIAKVR